MSKKKITDPEGSMEELIARAVEAAKAPFTPDRKAEFPSLRSVAEELGTTVIRTRKLLITAGYFTSPTATTVQRMKGEGKTIEEIGATLRLKPAAVYGYLPYENLAYNLPETTSNADRHKRYRATKKLRAAVDKGDIEKISSALWRCVIIFEGYPFSTSGRGARSGAEYAYQVTRRVSGGELTAEVTADYLRREHLPDRAFSSEKARYHRPAGTMPEEGVVIQRCYNKSQAA